MLILNSSILQSVIKLYLLWCPQVETIHVQYITFRVSKRSQKLDGQMSFTVDTVGVLLKWDYGRGELGT